MAYDTCTRLFDLFIVLPLLLPPLRPFVGDLGLEGGDDADDDNEERLGLDGATV